MFVIQNCYELLHRIRYLLLNEYLSVHYHPLYFIDFRSRCETMDAHKLREVGVTKGFKQSKKNFVNYSLKRDE